MQQLGFGVYFLIVRILSMSNKKSDQWEFILTLASPALRRQINQVINDNAKHLADAFYAEMLSRSDSKLFLTNEEVKNRLNSSMQMWIKELFSGNGVSGSEDFVLTQKKVGDVHARINLPVHLVLRGAAILKTEIHDLFVADQERLNKEVVTALYYSFALIDYAMEVMSEAYSYSHDRKMKAEESYRLFAAISNSDTEREKQSKALLDWENTLLYTLTMDDNSANLPLIMDSDFGLWFNHKGYHMFESEQKAIKLVRKTMQEIDSIINTIKADLTKNIIKENIKTIRKKIRLISLNIEDFFNKQSKLESGRDDLTRLLSRKFLPVIINKEISYSIKNKKPFAVLAIDIDYFKDINDQHGHEAGDMVLNQLGLLLSQNARAGDYVFRVGGEEFFIILVDIKNLDNAVRVANLFRERIAKEPFITTKGTLHITCSIGVIMHDGHPDYIRILNEVDEALYDAKNRGRNQVVVKF